jgi:hypothetical protein
MPKPAAAVAEDTVVAEVTWAAALAEATSVVLAEATSAALAEATSAVSAAATWRACAGSTLAVDGAIARGGLYDDGLDCPYYQTYTSPYTCDY